jgi:hypothetical protein
MAIPYTGLFIAASCNSRSSHGQYTRSSTEQLQYGAVTRASYWDRIIGTGTKIRSLDYVYTYTLITLFFQPNNDKSSLLSALALNTSNRHAA